MSKYHDDRTRASHPLGITMSDAKLRALQPNLYGLLARFTKTAFGKTTLDAAQTKDLIDEHMHTGDSRAALVALVEPVLIVAAYTDEQDAVLLLQFPMWLIDEYQLQRGTRLLTVNTYGYGPAVSPDIVPGPKATGRYANFYPIIAEFVSDDMHIIEQRKRAIAEEEWRRAGALAAARLGDPDAKVRDGRPLQSRFPGKPPAL